MHAGPVYYSCLFAGQSFVRVRVRVRIHFYDSKNNWGNLFLIKTQFWQFVRIFRTHKLQRGRFYEIKKHRKICLKKYSDIFLNGEPKPIKRFESSSFLFSRDLVVLKGSLYHSSTKFVYTQRLTFLNIAIICFRYHIGGNS